MLRLSIRTLGITALIVFALLASPKASHAQAELISANPAPDSTIASAPPEVRLGFSRLPLSRNSEIHVANEAGDRVDQGNTHIAADDPFALVVSLPLLFEGRYTVTYMASVLGGSTVVAGEYTFVINLPDPELLMKSPANGESFPTGEVPVRIQARFVDFGLYNTRILLYVDGEQYAELRGFRANIKGLSPGVHEIRIVLMQLEDFEAPQTASTVYIAVPRPDADKTSSEFAPPDLNGIQIAAVVAGGTALLIVGVWLGYRQPRPTLD